MTPVKFNLKYVVLTFLLYDETSIDGTNTLSANYTSRYRAFFILYIMAKRPIENLAAIKLFQALGADHLIPGGGDG